MELSTECNSLFFHCEQGHYLSIRDLLGEGFTADLEPSPETLRLWDDCERGLVDLARGALDEGQHLIAVKLQQAAIEIQQRLLTLHRQALAARIQELRSPSR